jgi:Ni/Co efflux regulator RcnB
MKVRITTAVAVVAVLIAAFAAVASAATESTITGKMTSFSYKASAKTGKLHIISSKGVKTTIALNAKTDCGVSYGQSGDQVPCKSFAESKYKNKPFRVTSKRYSDGHRVASVVAADLSK